MVKVNFIMLLTSPADVIQKAGHLNESGCSWEALNISDIKLKMSIQYEQMSHIEEKLVPAMTRTKHDVAPYFDKNILPRQLC